jgi:hypothetical protein
MSKQRIALVFSGQPRCIDGISYEGFRKCILDEYDVDVYAHFWGDLESDKSTGSVSQNIELFKTLYTPKSIQVDKPLLAEEFPLSFIERHSPIPITRDNVLDLKPSNWAYWVRNCVSMYTSMCRVYELVESSGVKYDWIIRTRTDCVLLRYPRLEKLDPGYMYAPDWHGPRNPVIVNHALIVPPSIAPTLFRIRHTLEGLRGNMDETFIYNHLWYHGFLDRVRTLPMTVFYPTLTRNGVQTDKPEPSMKSEVIDPPYSISPVPRV